MNAKLCGVVVTAALIFSPDIMRGQARSTDTKPSGTRSSMDWPVYGGQAAGDHFSSLSQINRTNVNKLQVAWKFDGGEAGGPVRLSSVAFCTPIRQPKK
jgi:glucose dehydrogenase